MMQIDTCGEDRCARLNVRGLRLVHQPHWLVSDTEICTVPSQSYPCIK